MAEAYDIQAVERKWQQRWAADGTYEVENDDPRPPYYVLSMYPYPSGRAHMGHVRNYTFGDLIVRHRTMRDNLEWPERVKTMQRNWIGRSEGAEFDLRVQDSSATIRVFTTRPDTSFGMTYVVLAPEHPLVPAITTDDRRPDIDAFVARVRN